MGLLEILGLSAVFAAHDAYKEEKRERQRRADFEKRTGAALDKDWNVLSVATDPAPAYRVSELRELYVSIKATCEPLDEGDICGVVGHSGRKLADMFEVDIMRFLLHVALADAPVNAREASFMNAVLGVSRTASEWGSIARRLQADSFAAAAEIPMSFQVMGYVAMASGSDFRDILMPLLDGLGTAMVKADGEMTQEELNRAEAYMDNVRRCFSLVGQGMTPPSYPLFLD